MELSGRFSDNWRGRTTRVGQLVEDIVGAIAFMEDVQRAQVQLNALGYNAGTVDGKLGPVTAAALKKFQLFESLPQTSLLDDSTKKRLDERTVGMVLKLPDGKVLKPSQLVQSSSNPVPDLTAPDLTVISDAWKAGTPAGVPGIANAPPLQLPPPATTTAPPSASPPSGTPGTPGMSTTAEPMKTLFGLSMTTVAVGAVGALALTGVGIALAMKKKDREPDTEPHPGPMPPPSYVPRNTLVTGGGR
jgi:peptidoglycan hydrolase-like protein with peptidoglycan-binding domain